MKKLYLILSVFIILLALSRVNLQAQEEYEFLPDKEAYRQEIARFFDKYGNNQSKDLLIDFSSYINKVELEENELQLLR